MKVGNLASLSSARITSQFVVRWVAGSGSVSLRRLPNPSVPQVSSATKRSFQKTPDDSRHHSDKISASPRCVLLVLVCFFCFQYFPSMFYCRHRFSRVKCVLLVFLCFSTTAWFAGTYQVLKSLGILLSQIRPNCWSLDLPVGPDK